MDAIVTLLHNESLGSWSPDWNYISFYNWTGLAGSLSPPVTNGGNGEPRLANGLVASSHRPSDDLCIFSMFSLSSHFDSSLTSQTTSRPTTP